MMSTRRNLNAGIFKVTTAGLNQRTYTIKEIGKRVLWTSNEIEDSRPLMLEGLEFRGKITSVTYDDTVITVNHGKSKSLYDLYLNYIITIPNNNTTRIINKDDLYIIISKTEKDKRLAVVQGGVLLMDTRFNVSDTMYDTLISSKIPSKNLIIDDDCFKLKFEEISKILDVDYEDGTIYLDDVTIQLEESEILL